MHIYIEQLDWKGSLKKRQQTIYIVIHHAAAKSCTVQDIHRWHLANGWSGIGYHFLVRKNGEVWRGRPLDTVGAHTKDYNNRSVGVCFEGDYQGADRVMPDEQMKAGRDLLKNLREKYPYARIMRHGDLMETDCPGRYFPYEELVNGKEDEIMSKEYDELNARLNQVEHPMIYNYVDNNMPEWARPTIQKLMHKGVLQGNENGELGLTDDLLRMLVINDRMGLYGE